MDGWLSLGFAILTATAAAGGAWAAVRVELKYMQRDIQTLQVQVGRMNRDFLTVKH